MTPETNRQMFVNADLVANFAGFGTLPKMEELEQAHVACESCGREVSEIETSRNAGNCDQCTRKEIV